MKTYFLKEDGKYVFVMYTTQKDDFVKKALKDLEKCFDANKTGIPAENVGEIVYCHTCGRLSAGDTQTLLVKKKVRLKLRLQSKKFKTDFNRTG